MVEPQPSKLMVRVRFPSPAPLNGPERISCRQERDSQVFQGRHGTRPVAAITEDGESNAHVAQSVEHFLGKEEVAGSIPVMSTNLAMPAPSAWLLSNQNALESDNHGQG